MKSWRNALVTPHVTLEQAIEVLDKAALRVVLVVDENEHLLGTLTDGDVRRALLKHLPLDVPVAQAMNANPKIAGQDWGRAKVLAVMEEFQVLQLPRVDTSGRLIGLDNLHDLLIQHRHDNPVFLMAGGFGTRLKPLTNNCPKPMLKVGDKPILEQILLNFVNAGFHRFYISTHYMPEVIRDHFGDGSQWGISIQYVHEDTPLGTGGALGLLPKEEITLPLIMMNGDLLTSINYRELLEFHQTLNSVATMCVREYEHQIPYGVVQMNGSYIESMEEKPIHKCFINAGIYVVSPELVSAAAHEQKIDMPSLLETEMAKGQKVSMFPVHEYWLDIGQMDDFKRAQEEVYRL